MSTQHRTSQRSVGRQAWLGGLLLLGLVVGFGGWAWSSQLSSAVIANGSIVVDTNVKKIQHPTGGVVGEIRVRNGQLVEENELLVRLDQTVLAANLAIVTKGITENLARQSRLEAERDGAELVVFPTELLANMADADVSKSVQAEEKLFELRRNARAGQKSQLRERAAQVREEIEGITRQSEAKTKETDLIFQELEGVRKLWVDKLIGIQRVMMLERDAARNEGERGQLKAQKAQAQGRISEIELQIIQIDQDLRSEVANSLRETQGRLAELSERKVAAVDQLKRVNIRSPRRGLVHQLSVFAEGAIVSPGEVIAFIVPADEALIVDAKVMPNEIDQLHLNQQAVLRFPAFNQKLTPEIRGHITLISADLTTDQRTGMSYYTIQLAMTREEVAALGEKKLISGMPVEVYVQTGSRSALSYLLKPLTDQFNRAFRER
jgi:HlyD family secretion protein